MINDNNIICPIDIGGIIDLTYITAKAVDTTSCLCNLGWERCVLSDDRPPKRSANIGLAIVCVAAFWSTPNPNCANT
jgi:hypothetical protein